MLQPKPKFNPNQPFEAVSEGKPAFDPNLPFEELKKKGSSVSNTPQKQQTGTTGLPVADGSLATPPPTKINLTTQEPTDMSGKPLLPKQKEFKEAFGKIQKEDKIAKEEKKKYGDIFDKQLNIKPRVGESQYLKDRLSSINVDLINREEEYVVPQLQYQFGDLGFNFEESGATGDYVKVTAPNGQKTEISLDNLFDTKSKAQSEVLQQFIKENTPAKGLFVLEKTMREQDKKFNSEKQVDDSVKVISNEVNALNAKQKQFLIKKSQFEKNLSDLGATPELEQQRLVLNEEMKSILQEEETIKQKGNRLSSAVGKYSISKSKQGTWGGAIWNAVNEGFSSISAGTTSLVTDIATEIAPSGFGMNPRDLKNISTDIAKKIGVKGPSSEQTVEQWKGTLTEDQLDKWEDEVDDYTKKDIKSKALPFIRVGNREIFGDKDTAKQFSDLKEEGFWGGAILGVAKSLPAMIGGAGPAGWAQKTAQMYAQISDGLAVEMENNPEFANITENEKLAITLPIGITSAVLEAYGLRNVMASKGVINSLTMSVLGKAGVGTSARTFRELVENEVESKLARGLLTITAAGLAEFETGAAQELTETGFKAIYNEIKGKGMFKTPESITDLIKNVAVAGAQEAVGGFVLGVPSGVSAAYSKKGFLKMDDASFETFANMANDEKMQSSYIANLKEKITQGLITEKEAKEQLNDYRNSAGLYRQLPEGLSTQQQKEAMNLLKEKKDLQNFVDGKDVALVVKQKNRITEINNELTKLSETDAVQEQTTDESVLRTEQPEVELQGVGEGNAKPEGVTTEKEIADAKQKFIEKSTERKGSELSKVELDGIDSIFNEKLKALEKPKETIIEEEPRIQDSQIPLKRETFEFESAEGDILDVQVTTRKDGSRDFVAKNKDGRVVSSQKVGKDNTLTTEKPQEVTPEQRVSLEAEANTLMDKGVASFREERQALMEEGKTKEEVDDITEQKWLATEDGKRYSEIQTQLEIKEVTPIVETQGLSEAELPGYDRMISEAEAITKEKRRGRKLAEMHDAVMGYVTGSKVYENATDVQRERLVRDVRKQFGIKEKSAPSVNKLFGKKRNKVTVDEMAALKDQIRLEARAAREAKADINAKRKSLSSKIVSLIGKGMINTTQAKTIINRINRTNLDNPIMVERLLEYAEKVFDNANYAKTISEIKKLQRQARSKNHTSMTNVVKEFTYINPELIPLDRIQTYIEALDFLNTRTPSYSKMNDILSEISSYETVDEFDAVKTMEALEKKYEKIELNNLKSVEEYVSLIRDINSFKRKAYQLLQDESITQEEYDNLINRVGNDQAAVEKKYEKEIAKLKNDLVKEIKKQRPKRNVDFSNEENNLIKKYLTLNDSDLKSLSPEDLFILNDILENISNGEIDYYRFNDIISKAFTNDGVNQLAKQIENSKFDMSSERGRQELSEQESAFWEGLLGMGRSKAGALQKFVISNFNRAIGSYESFIKNGYNEFLTLKKKYNIKDNEMHKIGILTTYLQEYMAQFDSKNKGINNIGKRDWFKEILNNTAMKDNYSSGKPSVLKMIGIGSSEIEIIQKIWDKLPKDENGDVNPKDVYESYIANDGKFFAKNEKSFFDDVMKYKQSTITPKQKAANELSGNSFKEVPFHTLRVRLDSGKRQIQPSVSSENGTVRIKANTGKERISEKIGPVMTNFEKLFISNIEQTGRDYFLSGSLKDINNTLSGVKKIVNKDKMPLLNTISYGLSDALEFEFDRVENNVIFKNLLSARAATALLNPIRTGVELVSSLISYPIRAKDFSGYYSLFNEQGIMKKLLEFTDSPMLLRENISKAIDINDGRIKPQSRLNKATNYLSGLPERTMMVTSWMPSFKAEFKNITDVEFDIDKFNNNESYREKYSKAIMESSAVADAQTEKIVGTTTKAGQRREVRIAPKFLANIFGSKGTVSKNTATGQILGFFSNYPFRESTEFINGFKEAAEVLKDEGALSSLSQLQKPFGIALNIASYGFFSTASYALGLVLLGDDDDEERGNEILKELMTLDGFLSELASNAISLAGSQYAAGGKAMLQIAATIGIMSADKEEDKNKIKKLLKDSVFINPLPIEQTTKFGGKDKALAAIGMYIPQFVILADRFTETIGSAEDIKVIYDKVEKDGIKALTEDEKLKILALNTLFNATQLMLNLRGTSIPEYNKLKIYMNSIKGEGGISKEELKKSDPQMYKIMYGKD